MLSRKTHWWVLVSSSLGCRLSVSLVNRLYWFSWNGIGLSVSAVQLVWLVKVTKITIAGLCLSKPYCSACSLSIAETQCYKSSARWSWVTSPYYSITVRVRCRSHVIWAFFVNSFGLIGLFGLGGRCHQFSSGLVYSSLLQLICVLTMLCFPFTYRKGLE